MKNAYEIRGYITAIFLNTRKGILETRISTDKLERAKEYNGTWYACWNPFIKNFYRYGNTRLPDGRASIICLHRWITECPSNLQVDHFNNITLDNADDNLRIVTRSQNHQNRSGLQRNNKSGVNGVSWIDGKWVAQITLKRKNLFRESFNDINEAEKAIKIARAKLMPYSKESKAK